MCGRFKLATDPEAIAREFDVAEVPAMPPRYNIAPTQPVLVVRAGQDGRRTATFLRWGLVPSWSRDAGGASRMINARSESAAGKPAFRDAMRRRRCLVVADGFYEWARDGKVRRPFLIALPGGRPFAFAGLWDRWEGPGGPLETCTILTTTATARVALLHDRMPVILRPEAVAPWLAGGPLAPDALAAICAPRPDEDLALAPVSPRGIVDTLRAVKEALLAELLAMPGAAWTFVPGDIGGKADPVTIDAPVYLAGVVRERTRDSHATELEPLLKPFMGRYPARAETLNAAVLGTAFGEKETRALEDLANGTVSLREAISVSPLMRIATLRLFAITGMAGLVEFRETGRSKVSPEEQLDELKREVARVQAADHFVRLGLHYTSHPKHFQAAWERLSARFGPTAAERALGPEAARLCDRLKAYFDEAYSVVRHTESRRSYRHSAIGAGTMKFGSEFLLKQANILLFREEFDAAMETVEAAIDIDPRPEFLQFRARVIQTRARILAERSKPTTSRPSGSGRPH